MCYHWQVSISLHNAPALTWRVSHPCYLNILHYRSAYRSIGLVFVHADQKGTVPGIIHGLYHIVFGCSCIYLLWLVGGRHSAVSCILPVRNAHTLQS